ncbi:alpha-2,8-polysialyltransferase family protein [Vibrio vulnificus]|uniref:alpha-2,8-polysialyltransferase family protein n=1 Tax=Vibrio vulnificus TaxID=672 RepID=UPI001CDC647B|nr:alpha-2,8-polysialyltransferase family protein [Vibrio vulnificus]EIV8496212.1 glycosyltransferase 52 family protein [Vibrio vulnificus]ELV8672972.1 glycosyltransferase 52 family protein [Vibrio vulnificus]MCA3944757.1 glycosyltransferase 52 family protein [Vibrio vulnificus]
MNVFLVTSPFQYICATEAREAYQTKNNLLILVNQDTEAGRKHLSRVFDSTSWDHIIEVGRNNRTFVIPKIIKQVKNLVGSGEIEHLFFSEYTSWRTRMFQRNLSAKKLVFIDDGMANLYEYYNFIKDKKPFTRKRFILDLLVELQGCKKIGTIPYADNFEMFSIFNIPDPVCPLKLNHLNVMRDKIGAAECYDPNGRVAFVGEGAIGDKNQPSIENYLSRLEKMVNSTPAGIIYFPHRTESQEVATLVKQLPNLKYHKSESPIEFEIAEKHIKISLITGVTSTALFTLSLLYKEVPISAHTYETHVGNEMIEFLIRHFNQRDFLFSQG